MASKDTPIEPENVAMRTRSRYPLDTENLATMLTRLETNDDVSSHHQQHEGASIGDENDLAVINELEASVQQMERELAACKARAIRAQRKRDLIKKMEAMQEELSYYQQLESSTMPMSHARPSFQKSEFLPSRFQTPKQQTDEWCEQIDDSASIISQQSSQRYSFASYNPVKMPQGELNKVEVVEPKIEIVTKPNTVQVKPETSTCVKQEEGTMEKILNKLVNQQRENALPKPDLKTFDGSDVLEFPLFMRNYKYGVEMNTSDPIRRLEILQRFTANEPRELVKNCITIEPPEEGYKRALFLLNREYGQPALLATAYRSKAESWPKVKSGDRVGLNRFYVFVTSISSAKIGNKELESTDGYEFLRTLASKLPTPLQQKWIREVGKSRETQKNLTLEDFEAFIGQLARDENDPRIAGLGYQARSQSKATDTPRKGTHACATTVKPADGVSEKNHSTGKPPKKSSNTTRKNLAERWPCLYCEGPRHAIADCRKFSSLKASEKSEHCKKRGLCFGCLNPGHVKRMCQNPGWAKCKVCQGKHATALHNNENQPTKVTTELHNDQNPPTKVLTGYISTRTPAHTNPKMAIIPVLIKPDNTETHIATYAFLDNGCGAVFVKDSLQRALHMQTKNTKLLIKTMNLEEVVRTKIIQGNLQVGSLDGTSFLDLPTVYVKDQLPVNRDDIPTQDDIAKWNHLKDANIQIPKLPRNCHQIADVTVMIGMNVPAASAPLEVVLGDTGEPYAQRSQLGWIVYGLPGKPNQDRDEIKINFCKVQNTEELEVVNGNKQLEEQFRQYANFEFNERLTEEKDLSMEDKAFMKIMENSAVKVDGHYQTALPFRTKATKMPSNKIQAEAYANSLKKRLLRRKEEHQEYTNFMEELVEKGYAEKVPDSELARNDGRVWYIPHHCVKHPRKPDKVRVVFNCPVVYKGYALNTELLQGPDLTNRLYGVLLRWRQEPVAITGDIESMFYQVRVNPDDCDMLRYLWWPEGNLNTEPEEYRMLVHLFGAVSSPGCANYALRKTAQDNAAKYDKEITDAVRNDFYVDDFVKSVGSVQSGIKIAHDVTKILSEGGFKLTKWSGNDKEVLESIPVDHRAKDIKNVDLSHDNLPNQRTLGVQWCVETDQLEFSIADVNKKATRRNMLSVMSSIYDPFGPTAPFVLKSKIMLQELCRQKLDWDESIPQDIEDDWNKWLKDLAKLDKLKMKRCYRPDDFGKVTDTQLHSFSDASETGYGVASYLRFKNRSNQVHCAFVCGKARVAPLKPHTIVKLELAAATLAVRQTNLIMKELTVDVDSVVFWTDSQTVLKYIRNEKARHPVFVANRVALIRDSSSIDQWKYVPSKSNPADHASRGLSVEELSAKKEWLQGPEFLWKPESEWPTLPSKDIGEEEINIDENERVSGITVQAVTVQEKQLSSLDEPGGMITMAAETKQKKSELGEDILHKSTCNAVNSLIEYFSDWTKLKRSVAWLLRLKKLLQRKTVHPTETHNEERANTPLTVEEIDQAEEAIVRYVQQENFSSEINLLQKTGRTPQSSGDSPGNQKTGRTPQSSGDSPGKQKTHTQDRNNTHIFAVGLKKGHLASLDPVLQDGILKVGGRLKNASIPQNAKHQMILPKHHHVSTLIIRHIHSRVKHQGCNHILSELRQKFWILKARAAVKSVIRKCVICKKYQAKAANQKMADLPASRVKPDEPAFSRTGMDYFGPFEVRQGRTRRKRYGVIFTCLNCRAVHIEVAESLDTSSCVDAVRRFVARRGNVKEIYSDNGTNLVSTNKELRTSLKDLDQDLMNKYATSRGIQWYFNPPAASHHGGVWERQIRTIRKIMNAILNEQNMKTAGSDEQLRTLMCEIEMTINSRPLTRMSDDPNDLDVITPQNLLLLHQTSSVPPGIFEPKDLYARRRWRQMQYLAELFWKRWVKEYLPELQRRQRWLKPERNVQPGDVVLVIDEKAPRNSWLMGLVQETHPDKNGLTRSAKIKTKASTLTRPVNKLCLLLERDME